MSAVPTAANIDEPKGLRRFAQGALFGLTGGVVGLALPVSINLLAAYGGAGPLRVDASLIALTSVFVLVGAVFLFASLLYYRLGFGALRRFDRWFLAATVLCTVGSVGLLLIAASIALALNSTPALDACIRGAPTHALTCLKTVQPLTAYSVVAGFWLAWIGGLGIVLGLVLGARRYGEPRLVGGGAVYGLLLLVLIAPFVTLLFPVGGWQYPVLTLPALALLGPALVYSGSRRGSAPRLHADPAASPA